jgi:CheY-like chemotaxis protein
MILENGYEIHEFNNLIEALDSFEKDLYNLIILDIKMPKMNGFEFYEKVRKIDNKFFFFQQARSSLIRILKYSARICVQEGYRKRSIANGDKEFSRILMI